MDTVGPRLYLTGGTLVEHAGGLVREDRLGGRQGRLALALLAWERHRAVSRDELADLLWGDGPPASAEAALAAVVSNLRGAIGAAGLTISSSFGCYQLQVPDTGWVDVEAARHAVHEGEGARRAGRMRDVYAWTGVATAITRRPLLPGEDGGWIEARRRDLVSWRIRALDLAVEFATWNGEHAAAVAHAETLVDLDPFREVSHRRLIGAHAAAGDRAGALRAYERCRTLLADELGVDPSTETATLYTSLLA